jgi:DNA-binding MarR family transcriptional regulator
MGMDSGRASNSSRYRALLQLLRSADAVWNLSHIFFSRWNLSPSQFNVLSVLHSEPGGISQIDLGRVLITHRSNVTGLVNRLQSRGLVQRKKVSGDKRAYSIVLTAKGVRLLEDILPAYYQRAEEVWERFPSRSAAHLAVELARLEKSARARAAAETSS